jgi:transcriptional regulator with XRE-family HTH domain
MDVWPHRDAFQARVREYQARTGVTQDGVAEVLGTTTGTLRGWLYNRKRRPSFDTLQAAAALFGCSVTEFVDDPGAPPEGAPVDATEFDRFMLRAMGSDLEALTDEQKVAAFEAWKATMKAFKARKG